MSTAWVLLRPVACWVYLTLWNLNKIDGSLVNKQEFQEERNGTCLYRGVGRIEERQGLMREEQKHWGTITTLRTKR